MSSICVLTDSAVQFTQPGFAGRDDVRVIPFDVELNGIIYPEGEGTRAINLPPYAGNGLKPRLLAPSSEKFYQVFVSLSSHYREVVAVLTSCELSQAYANAEKAAAAVKSQITVTLIDSMTTSVGLGLLVQIAAEAAAQDMHLMEIERRVRKAVPRVYTIISTVGLSYLSQSGFVDPAQAVVGELLGLIPIFSLEEGKLSAIEKARNQRGVLDFFQEFLSEFDNLQHIAFVQGIPPFNHEAHLLREHSQVPRPPAKREHIENR